MLDVYEVRWWSGEFLLETEEPAKDHRKAYMQAIRKAVQQELPLPDDGEYVSVIARSSGICKYIIHERGDELDD